MEVLETFKITKVGTIAGCIVRDGKITRSSKVRVIRDGIVIFTGELGSLKRFKDDIIAVISASASTLPSPISSAPSCVISFKCP